MTSPNLRSFFFTESCIFANFAKIRNLIDELKTPFDIIAITETWLESDNYLDFLLNDYEFCHKNRLNKKGGGVAIYVHKTLNFKMQKNMSMVIDDVMDYHRTVYK